MKKQNNPKTQVLKKTGRGGVTPPVERQFGKPGGNKQGRGFWRKEDTPRYKLEQMMKLNKTELQAVAKDEEAPLFDRKLAAAIRDSDWYAIERMINQVYGKPTERIEHKVVEPKPILDLTKE